MLNGLLALLGFVAAIAVVFFLIYNRLITLRNRVRNAYAQIDVQLRRRHELVPNLVESARAYLAHERATLEGVTEARGTAEQAREAAAADPGRGGVMEQLAGAERALSGALVRLYAVAEAYPDLKADTTVAQLMEELTSTDNRIAFARQAFNDSVMDYNTGRETFPNLLVAGPMRFAPAAFFEERAAEVRAAPRVSL